MALLSNLDPMDQWFISLSLPLSSLLVKLSHNLMVAYMRSSQMALLA